MKTTQTRWLYRYWHSKFRQGWTVPQPSLYVHLCAKKAAHGYVNLGDDNLRLRARRVRYGLVVRRCYRTMHENYPILKLDPRRLP